VLSCCLAVNSDLAPCPAQIRLVNTSIGCAHKHVCMLCDKCQLQSVILYSQLSSLCCRRSYWLCSEPSCEGCFVAFETKQELQEHHQLVHAPLMPHLPRTQEQHLSVGRSWALPGVIVQARHHVDLPACSACVDSSAGTMLPFHRPIHTVSSRFMGICIGLQASLQ